jgi:hypothetical protein
MKQWELHGHYLRIEIISIGNVVNLDYCRIDDWVANKFPKPLSEAKFVKVLVMLGLETIAIMGGV